MLASTGAMAQAQAKKRLVCWKDAVGNRSCGDSVPPQFANKEKKILDGTGRTVKTLPAALTAEEWAALEAKAQQDAVAKREADRQAAYDRALLDTYLRPEELVALRNDRLATIDTSIELIESALRRDTVSVAELRSRVPQGKPPGKALADNIARFEVTLRDNQHAVSELRRNRETVCSTFTRDIARFQELKTGTITFESPCPAPGSLGSGKDEPVDLAAARRFFDHFTALERDFDPALLDLYADSAMVRTSRKYPDGQVKQLDLSIGEYRAIAQKALPLAQQARDTNVYSNLKVEPEGNSRARISGTRTSERKQYSAPFYMVVKGGPNGWRILEEWSESQP
jgi:hypothetical protein